MQCERSSRSRAYVRTVSLLTSTRITYTREVSPPHPKRWRPKTPSAPNSEGKSPVAVPADVIARLSNSVRSQAGVLAFVEQKTIIHNPSRHGWGRGAIGIATGGCEGMHVTPQLPSSIADDTVLSLSRRRRCARTASASQPRRQKGSSGHLRRSLPAFEQWNRERPGIRDEQCGHRVQS